MKDVQIKTKEFFDKFSYPDGGEGRRQYMIKKISNYLDLDKVKGKKVLDVGCGTGTFSNIFSMYGADVYAVDQSEESVKKVRKKYPKIKAQVGDALNLPFEDNKFDLTMSMGVLDHTPDCYQGFKECARVTKNKGNILILLYRKYHVYPILYKIISLFIKNKDPKKVPKFILFPVKLFVTLYYGEKTSWKDARNLLADQYFAPRATFHTKAEINDWAKKLDLRLLKTGHQYFWQHGVYYLQKSSQIKDSSEIKDFRVCSKI